MLMLKQSTIVDIRMGPFVDATDGVTPVTVSLGSADQAEVLKANGATTVSMSGNFAAIADAAGWYDYTLIATDVDVVGEVVFVVQDSDVCLPVFVRAQVVEESVYEAWYASSADLAVNVTEWLGTAVTAASAGRPDVNLKWVNDSTGPAGYMAAIFGEYVTGTTDSGTTTSFVDLARGEADDAWVGSILLFRDGPNDKRSAIVTDFNASTDTITFAPALASVGTDGYILIPGASLANVEAYRGTAATSTLAGKPDVNLTHVSGDNTAANNLELAYDGTGYVGGAIKPQVNMHEINGATSPVGNLADDYDGTGYVGGTIKKEADIVKVSGSYTGANNLEAAYDGTGYAGGTIKQEVDAVEWLGAAITGAQSSPHINALNDVSTTQMKNLVDTALTDIHLDHLLAVNYDPASPPGVTTALLNELVETDGGVSRFTTNALENGPTDSGATVGAIADAVWDEAKSGHTSADTFGKVVDDILTDTGTTVPDQITALNNISTAQVNTEVDTAIETYHLQYLFHTDYNPAIPPGVTTALLNELVEDDSGVARLTTNALEQAPSGGATAGEIANAVWDEAQVDHTGGASFGALAIEIATIDGIVDTILTDTSSTLDTKLTTVDAVVDAIKVKTDNLTFTSGTDLDVNVQRVNDIIVAGTGAAGNEWGPV